MFKFVLIIAVIFSACRTAPVLPPEVEEIVIENPPVQTAALEVLEPVFSVIAIAILRDELINTRFRVSLQIENPNPFSVELAALSFRLYGNGRLWADGTERNIIGVDGESTHQSDLFLTMNFIDMDRRLLDQVISLEDVHYRFTGNAEVTVGIEDFTAVRTSFDLSGNSQVLDR